MIGANTSNASCASYELEVTIQASRQQVWDALTDETNAWWLPDFHMVGAGSRVSFDTRAGGCLIEHLEGGGSLLWYTVHWCRPEQFTIYLVGQVAPDWGGPSTSHLKLAIVEGPDGSSILQVSDAHHGNVGENLQSLHEGWTDLFTRGLKAFVEDGVRQDG